MFNRLRTVAFVNGRVSTPHGCASSIRFTDRIVAIDEQPQAGDVTIDLDGAFVLPGLINAHDHLELNHYGRQKGRVLYQNATAWIDDLRPRLRDDDRIRRNAAFPLRDRLFIGGLKNLLSGVTTVAHHNPFYRELRGRFPVRVVRRFAWAHSFALEGQPVGAKGELGESVRERCLATPSDVPFIVHAGEGVDSAAADEMTRLDAAGCLRPNTVLVHGVALRETSWKRLVSAGSSLIWCPASNTFLFGKTIQARAFLDAAADAASHLCLGTDSRLTGSRDLLDELRAARAAADAVTPAELLRMVTASPASALRLTDAGRIARGQPADLLVLSRRGETDAEALVGSGRGDVACVTVAGRPMLSDRRFCTAFSARGVSVRPMIVDERERLAEAGLVRDITRCAIHEPGVMSRA